MASGTQEHHHHHQQQQQQQDHIIQQQQHQNNQMQFASNQSTGLAANFNSHQQILQVGAMSPISAPMSVDNTQGHIISMNPHQHQQTHMMDTVMGSALIGQDSCNQPTSHIHHQLTSQQQKSQLLPLLLSPRPPSLKSGSAEPTEQPESDHDQIIEQVISLENEYSDSSGTMANVDNNIDMMMGNQRQHGDMNLTGVSCASDSNQLSSSSEDLLNLLLEFDGEPSNLIGLDGCQQLDPDEKAGIENIRKQLMSCEVQSDQAHNQNTNSMSPIINQMTCSQTQSGQLAQTSHNMHQQQQVLTQSGSVISHHQQQPHHLSSPGLPQPAQQQLLMHGSYSNVPVSTVPISTSGQSYAPPQQHQNVARISHSNPMSIVNNSPSPSWQQPQLSPYSPQNTLSNTRATPSQRQNQHPAMPQHQNTTSPQMQQLHHPIQRASPSQSVSPPATTEPSPVVKKNPLLNAQLVNSRPPSITPTRFLNNQANVLNQNPILNAKLSQSPFVNNTGGTVGSSLNQSLNNQSRYIQQPQQASSYNYDLSQQQNQQNAQQHTPPQQTVHLSLYRPGNDQQQQQQQSNQIFKNTTASTSGINTGGGSPMAMGSTSPSGGLSQQVKQEIRRKVQQPKQQQHQTTSLLKQLLSDDNK